MEELKPWNHLYWNYSYARSVWNIFFGVFNIQVACPRAFSDMIKEFLLQSSFEERGFYMEGGGGVCFDVGYLGERNIRIFCGVEIEPFDI